MGGVKIGTEKQIPSDLVYWRDNLPSFSLYYLANERYNMSRTDVDLWLRKIELGTVEEMYAKKQTFTFA